MRKVLADMHVPPAWRRWSTRAALALAVALAIAYLPLRGSDDQAGTLREQLDDVRAESARLADDNARLLRRIDALTTDLSALEDHARDHLGMVYPGEVMLRLAPVPAPAGVPPGEVTP